MYISSPPIFSVHTYLSVYMVAQYNHELAYFSLIYIFQEFLFQYASCSSKLYVGPEPLVQSVGGTNHESKRTVGTNIDISMVFYILQMYKPPG